MMLLLLRLLLFTSADANGDRDDGEEREEKDDEKDDNEKDELRDALKSELWITVRVIMASRIRRLLFGDRERSSGSSCGIIIIFSPFDLR